MSASRVDAERDQVVVPVTLEDYCIKTQARPDAEAVDIADFYDDDYLEDEDATSSDGGTASRRPSRGGSGPSAAPGEPPERAASAPDSVLRPTQSWPPS